MSEHVHFVRHTLRSGDSAHPEFKCTATEGAQCRVACRTCSDGCEETCMCGYYEREPVMEDFGECLVMVWLREEPDESYDGVEQPVRGPEWVPIEETWEGDYYSWDYAEPLDKG